MSDKDKNEHETWDLSKEKNSRKKKQCSHPRIKCWTCEKKWNKTAPILLNNCVPEGMSEVLCKAN